MKRQSNNRTDAARLNLRQALPNAISHDPVQRRDALLTCLFLVVSTLLAYSPCLLNGFINYDDPLYITQNSHLLPGLTLETVRWSFTTFHAGNWHPLTWISHALDVQLFGMSPAGHHFISMLLHALNTVLLFLLLANATRSLGRSLVVATLFAVHPLNVECVAWAAERKSVLSTLLFFLALGAYGWYARKPSIGRYAMVAGFFALGLMAKPMVITLPLVLLLLDYWPLQRIEPGTPPRERWEISRRRPLMLFVEKVPLLFLSAASAVTTLAAQRPAVVSLSAVPFAWRMANALNSYALYLFKAVWPVNLGPLYPRTPPKFWPVILSCSLLLTISLLVWCERKLHPYLLTGWLWYLGTLVPVIGLVQVGAQAMADRYAYIPLLGIFVMVVWRLADVQGLPEWPRRVVVAAMLMVLAALTVRQTGFWRNAVSLWTHTLQITHDNSVAEDNLGTALMDLGRDDEAIQHFRNAVRIQPGEPKARLVLGTLLLKRGDVRPAIEQFQTALSLTADHDDLMAVYTNLGVAYRQIADYDGASRSFSQLLQLDPSNMQAVIALGRVRLLAAVDRLTHDVDQRPSAEGFSQLGQLLEQVGEVPRARQAYQSSLALNHNLASAQDGLQRLAKSPE